MKKQFTLGPWIIDPSPTLPLAIIANTEDGDGICEIGERTPENLTNANLIAAAPDMYAILKKMNDEYNHIGADWDEDWIKFFNEVSAALSKANPQ